MSSEKALEAGVTPVKSPCISVCALDQHDVCTGCYRTVEEIRQWSSLDNSARREVVLRANARCKARYS